MPHKRIFIFWVWKPLMYLSSCHFYTIPQGGLILSLFYLALACKRTQMLMNEYFSRDSLPLSWKPWQSLLWMTKMYISLPICCKSETPAVSSYGLSRERERERDTHSWCCGLILNELLCFHTEVPGKWPQWPSVWYLAFAFSHSLIFVSILTTPSLACIVLSVDL